MNPLYKLIIKIIINWFPFALTVTLTAFLVYGTVQHSFRSSANDPQIQITEDLASKLADGADPSALLAGEEHVDISKSLATFTVIFDDKGDAITSTGNLHGKNIPSPPSGVLDYAREHGQNRITWQPEQKIRQAIVVTYFDGGEGRSGYVLAGRSLREIELREKNMVFQIFMWWGIALIVTIIASSSLTLTRQTL